MLVRPRLSRICYNRKIFAYPLKPAEAFLKLGPIESFRCGLSYLWARLFPVKSLRNFQEWVTNQFGRRLFEIFFKTYTEKVWGMPCTEISADWCGATNQRVVLIEGGPGGVASATQNGQRRGDQNVDQFVSLSATRAGDDVGKVHRKNSRIWRRRAARPTNRAAGMINRAGRSPRETRRAKSPR